jgi:heme/copper-type cytochrome/quinol oxidase subunit 3
VRSDDPEDCGPEITSPSGAMERARKRRIVRYVLAAYFVLGATFLTREIYVVKTRHGEPVPSPLGMALFCLAQDVLVLLVVFRGRRALSEVGACIARLVPGRRAVAKQPLPVWATLIVAVAGITVLIAVYVWPDVS